MCICSFLGIHRSHDFLFKMCLCGDTLGYIFVIICFCVVSQQVLYSKHITDSSIGLSTVSVYVHSTWNNPFVQSYKDICSLDKLLSIL